VDRLQWSLELLDRISGPARRAERALRAIDDTLTRAGRGVLSFEKYLNGAARGCESWVTKLSSAINVVGAVGSAVVAVTGAVARFSAGLAESVIQQAAFHQSTMTTFNTLLRGERGGGAREFAGSLRLGSMLAGTTEQFVGQRRDLVTQGFRDRGDRDVAFALLQDMAAMRPDDTSIGSRLAVVLGQIRGQDRVMGNDLLQLTNAGVGRADFARALLANRTGRGMDSFNPSQVRGMLGQVSSGGVRGNEAFRAIARVVTNQTGMRLGGFAAQQGNSISGMLSNLSDAPATLLQRMFLRGGGPEQVLGPFTRTLRQLNEMMQDGSPVATRLTNIMERLITGVFGQLDNIDVAGTVTQILDVFEGLAPIVTSTVAALREFFGGAWSALRPMLSPLLELFHGQDSNSTWLDMFRDAGRLLGFVGGLAVWFVTTFALGLVALTASIVQVWDWLTYIGTWLRDANAAAGTWLVEAGRNLILGMINGIVSAWSSLRDAVSNVATNVIDTVRGVFRIHSPSLVFADIGRNVALGMAMGIDSGADHVSASMGSLLGAPGGANAFRLASGAAPGSVGAAPSISLTIQVDGAGQGSQELAQTIAAETEMALARLFERMAVARGVG
jgi:hypothetical protein